MFLARSAKGSSWRAHAIPIRLQRSNCGFDKWRLAFGSRVLGIDNAVAEEWGRMSAIRPIPVIDGLLAATAVTNDLTLVTRNDRDIAGLGAVVLNPFRISENGRS